MGRSLVTLERRLTREANPNGGKAIIPNCSAGLCGFAKKVLTAVFMSCLRHRRVRALPLEA